MLKRTLIVLLLLMTLILKADLNSYAQHGPKANHIALYVHDLKKSVAFYKDALLLKEIPEPFHDGKHVWLRTGAHTQLHLIQGAAEVVPHDINSHFAYSVPNLPDFLKHLDKLNIKYQNWKGDSNAPQVRPDGVKQVYLQDPDNIWIEINDDKY